MLGLSGCAKIESRDLIREGNALYNDGQYIQAIEKYTASLDKEPDGVTVLWNRACAAEALVLKLKNPDDKEQQDKYADIALKDFQTWYERLEEPTAEDTEQVENHRLVVLDAASRCEDLKAHWLEKHRQDPKKEELYTVIARQLEKCGDHEGADAWYVKRTEDFPQSVRAWHALALRKFDPLWPNPDSGLAYNEDVPPAERIKIANDVIANLDKATELDPSFRDAYVWRAMAYTQRQNARIVIDEPELPEERIEAILAREDALLAWKNQKAVCDLEGLEECPGETPETPCCPPAPLTAEEQAADAEAKQKILAELKAAEEAVARKFRKGKKKR